jgi:hypothetical protein
LNVKFLTSHPPIESGLLDDSLSQVSLSSLQKILYATVRKYVRNTCVRFRIDDFHECGFDGAALANTHNNSSAQ